MNDTPRPRALADPEAFLGTLARLHAAEGAAREVAVLTYSTPEIVEVGYDSWNGGRTFWEMNLHAPINLFTQLKDAIDEIEKAILQKAENILSQYGNHELSKIRIVPAVIDDPQWREKAAAWLSGDKISNQGRVRSGNVAPLLVDGLLFRSQAEIHLYRALKAQGITFAPLAVFVRGGETYRRIEPDFFLVHAGITVALEVDGDTVHEETPAEAHARTAMLQQEGVYVERIKASECDSPEKAKVATARLRAIIDKHKAAR
jgi:hypothetical protein